MMILAAELQMDEFSHLKINTAYIALLQGLDKNIVFYGGKKQGELIKKELGRKKGLHCISTRNGHHSKLRVFKELFSFFSLIHLAWILLLTKPKMVLVLSASPLAKYVLFRMNALLRHRIVFVFHGELEGLKCIRSNILSQSFWTARLLRKLNKTSYALIMDERVYLNACRCLQVEKMNQCLLFQHPFVFDGTVQKGSRSKKMIRAGFPGVASLQKRSQYMYAVAAQLEKLVASKKLSLEFAGKVNKDVRDLSNGLVIMKDSETLLSEKDYSQALSSLDVFMLFYGDDDYSLTSSGAVFDILVFEKPVIALDSALMREFFATYGTCGVLCRDIKQMTSVMQSLVSGSLDIEKFRKAIRAAKKEWTVKRYTEAFHQALSKGGLLLQ
jgi:hypothetical protein